MTKPERVKYRTEVELVRIEHDKDGRPMNVYRKRQVPVVERSKVCMKELR